MGAEARMKETLAMTTDQPRPPEAPDKTHCWIVGARAIAICAVVMVHSDYILWETEWLNVRPPWWWTANFLVTLSTGGVVIFTMISGTLLLNPGHPQSISRFFKRRFLRIMPPYLLWSAIYFAWRIYMEEESLSWSHFPASLANGGAYYHLWFMLMIVQLYLLTPLLRVLIARMPLVVLLAALLLWLGGFSLLPILQHAWGSETWIDRTPAWLSYLGYVGFFVCGHYLSQIRLKRAGCLLAGLGWLTGFVWTGWSTYRDAQATGGILSEEWGDHNFYPQVILMATCAFLILRNLSWESLFHWSTATAVITATSSASFTAYLLHPLVMTLLDQHIPHAGWHPLLGMPLTFAVSITLCVLFAVLAQKLSGGWLGIFTSAIAPWNSASRFSPSPTNLK